jgi:cytochrome P450
LPEYNPAVPTHGQPVDAVAAATHPDPYPYYAELIARRPLHRDDSLGLWVAASAAAVTAALTSEACRVRPLSEPVPKALIGTAAGDLFGRLVRMNDGAYHTRTKPAVSATLAMLDAKAVADAAREAAQALATELDPARQPKGIMDLAFRLPAYALAGLLGLPIAARPEVAERAGLLVRALAPGATGPDVERGGDAAAALLAAVRALSAYRSASEDAVANAVGFFSQSYEATAGLIGNTLVAMARQPGVRERIAAEPAALASPTALASPAALASPTALSSIVSEVARHDPPVQNTRRWVAKGAVVAGQAMAEGDAVLVVLAAANRDPAANADPERFDPDRRERRVFTFGTGGHACPGEMIAVTIATAGVAALLAAGVEPERVAAAPAYRPSPNTRVPLFT